jgi:hypothetical protein
MDLERPEEPGTSSQPVPSTLLNDVDRGGSRMDIADAEREFLNGMRALEMNEAGEEVYVGLSRPESVEFLSLMRNYEAGTLPPGSADRFEALRKKHEDVRQRVVAGEAPINHSGADGSRATPKDVG